MFVVRVSCIGLFLKLLFGVFVMYLFVILFIEVYRLNLGVFVSVIFSFMGIFR